MEDNTTISCHYEEMERFNQLREERETPHSPKPTQTMMLRILMDTYQSIGSNFHKNANDEIDEEFHENVLTHPDRLERYVIQHGGEAFMEGLTEWVEWVADQASDGDELDMLDIQSACQAAIREELGAGQR